MFVVREETPEDAAAVRTVNEQAFERPHEARLVDQLRAGCEELLSLVAERDGRVVGHVLFSPIVVEGGEAVAHGMALGPVAVLPEWQYQGAGAALIEGGIATLRESGCPFVIVLGHPRYYPRFGFEPASRRGIRCQYDDVPDEAFMVLVLNEAAMLGVSGIARYRKEFDEAL